MDLSLLVVVNLILAEFCGTLFIFFRGQFILLFTAIYRLPKKAGLLQSPVLQYTYSWFPTEKFEKWQVEGNKAFGLRNNAYIALIAKNPLTLFGDDLDRLIQEGQDTFWITEMGKKEDFENFEEFIETINSRKITWNDGKLTYELPSRIIELNYNENLTVNKIKQNSSFDRYESSYVHSNSKDSDIIFNWNGESLKLNFSNSLREFSGEAAKISFHLS